MLYVAGAVGAIALVAAGVRAVACMRSPGKVSEHSRIDKLLRDCGFAYSIAVCNLITMVAGMRGTAGFSLAGFLFLLTVASNILSRKSDN